MSISISITENQKTSTTPKYNQERKLSVSNYASKLYIKFLIQEKHLHTHIYYTILNNLDMGVALMLIDKWMDKGKICTLQNYPVIRKSKIACFLQQNKLK